MLQKKRKKGRKEGREGGREGGRKGDGERKNDKANEAKLTVGESGCRVYWSSLYYSCNFSEI